MAAIGGDMAEIYSLGRWGCCASACRVKAPGKLKLRAWLWDAGKLEARIVESSRVPLDARKLAGRIQSFLIQEEAVLFIRAANLQPFDHVVLDRLEQHGSQPGIRVTIYYRCIGLHW